MVSNTSGQLDSWTIKKMYIIILYIYYITN